jgi:predicted RecA/RadA family phage recombinase
MHLLRAPLLGLAALATLAGGLSCSSSAATATPAQPDVTFDTGEFDVAPGDSFECFYTSVKTATELSVTGASGVQQAGGHHLTVYYTDQNVPVGHHPCSDAEMVAWHQIGATNGNKEGVVDLPAGYATKVPAGKQIVMQSHYINTTGATAKVHDSIAVHTADPSQVKAYANSFVMVDAAFELPPNAETKSVSVCSVPQDLDVITLLGHMHEWGSYYKLEQLDAAGAPSTIYETAWELSFPSHPPVNRYDPTKPLHFPAGTRLRQTCTWKNDTADKMTFPREMCLMFTYYIPDTGWIDCKTEEQK